MKRKSRRILKRLGFRGFSYFLRDVRRPLMIVAAGRANNEMTGERRSLQMNYAQFITEVQKYWDLRKKGLKKQANRFLFAFTKQFTEEVPTADADAILFQFCKEYLDEMKFPGENAPRRHLPFQMIELLDQYLSRACEAEQMPQMRWAFQIFGRAYPRQDWACAEEPNDILVRAYRHADCDPQTVRFYFEEQINVLFWGQHHFPEACLITQTAFAETVETAKNILAEKTVDARLVEEFTYYVKLYQLYFQWEADGRPGDFGALCEKKGLTFDEIPAFYYEK